MKKTGKSILTVLILVLLPIVFFFGTICIGRYSVSIPDVFASIKAVFSGSPDGVDNQTYIVVTGIRIPRALIGLLVGASLAASGTCFQSLFRNPLVSSGMLGVSAGAGFGAALSIVILGTTAMTPAFSFAFGIGAVILSVAVGKMTGARSAVTLVLGGTIIQSIFRALLALLKYMADENTQLPAITFWLMGSLASTKPADLRFSIIPMIVGLIGMLAVSWRLNILSMGDREARTMGLNVKYSKIAVIGFATLATAGAVSISGIIGWVGLIIPHICRMIVGSDNRRLIPASISAGACFMVLVDTICRTMTTGEVPLGVVTAIIGGPFFIGLLKKTTGGAWT